MLHPKNCHPGKITTTGSTILALLDDHMEDLLHLSRVTICLQIKQLLLQHLEIESIWISNVSEKSTDYKGLSIKHANGEMSFLNMW